jgi:hypothetical protein
MIVNQCSVLREHPRGIVVADGVGVIDERVDTPLGPRACYRHQVRAGAQELAWGADRRDRGSRLSLKARAKQMGMTAPALYRYLPAGTTEPILLCKSDGQALVSVLARKGRASART